MYCPTLLASARRGLCVTVVVQEDCSLGVCSLEGADKWLIRASDPDLRTPKAAEEIGI